MSAESEMLVTSGPAYSGAAKWAVLTVSVEAAATALVLFVRPSLFAWLVFGAEFSEAGLALGRLTAFALFGLSIATWPSDAPGGLASSVRTLLIYNVMAAVYLSYVGVGGQLTGILLWPAVALHGVFSVLLGRVWLAVKGFQKGEGSSWKSRS